MVTSGMFSLIGFHGNFTVGGIIIIIVIITRGSGSVSLF